MTRHEFSKKSSTVATSLAVATPFARDAAEEG